MKIVHVERLIDEGGISSTPGKHENGVVPIKEACMIHLASQQWIQEYVLSAIGVGKIDAALHTNTGLFGFEWETGNISSSHRAINKMALALLKKVLIGGVLVLPSRSMYNYLTDRIGNFPELQPYFPLWKSLNKSINAGVLEIVVIEHDAVSPDVPRITKGTDGRALV